MINPMSESIREASSRVKVDRTNFVYTKLVEALPDHLLPSIGVFRGNGKTSHEDKLLAIGGYLGVYEGYLDGMEQQAEIEARRAELEVAQDYLAGYDDVYSGTKFEVAAKRNRFGERVGKVALLAAQAAGESIKPKWAVEGYTDAVEVIQTHREKGYLTDDAYIKMKCLFDASVRAKINGNHRKLLLHAAKYMQNKVLETDGNQIYPTGTVPADYAYHVGREYITTIVDSILKPNIRQKEPATLESLVGDFLQENPAIPESHVRRRIESHIAYALDVILRPDETHDDTSRPTRQIDGQKKKVRKSDLRALLSRDDIDDVSRKILEVTLSSKNQSVAAARMNLTYREYLKEWALVRDAYQI